MVEPQSDDFVEEQFFLVRVAEQAERFDDMLNFIETIVNIREADLQADEINLIDNAFKNSLAQYHR